MDHIGNKLGNTCDDLEENLHKIKDKNRTMNGHLNDLIREKKLLDESRAREVLKKKRQDREMQKTKAIFERSLSEIRNTYERSQNIMKKDFGELEKMAANMKDLRKGLR